MENKSEVTRLLLQLDRGDKEAYDRIYPLIYEELRRMAYAHMSRQRNHTFSKTELVHEAYLKMVNHQEVDFNDRSHFLAIASKSMRQILVDYARKKNAQKRGNDQKKLTYIDELYKAQEQKADELIGIDSALDRLAERNQRLSEVVEMRFFGKMTIRDTAEALDVSESTVKRDWIKARGWLHKELKEKFDI